MNENSSALLAALVGSVTVTILGSWALLALFPKTANDGQAGMLIFMTVPVGAIAGVLWSIRKKLR